ncbi:MAG: SMP-30/gluconolactonase/LRE family protein [Bacteroidota bacterium]
MTSHHHAKSPLSLFTIHLLLLTVFATPGTGFAQVLAGGTLERLWTGFQFVEGPVWKEGVGLLFSDIYPSTIYRWSPGDSSMAIYLKPSDSSNGLTFDRQGNLILTQMQKRRIARQEPDGSITPLVSTYNGKRFNSPNDIVVSSSGSIFFTDPDFNVPAGQSKELSIKGIYRLSPSGRLQVIDSTFDKPNGICFAADESRLYVNESAQHKIYVWDVVNDSTFTNKRLFYTIPQSGYADGMKVDSSGNVYCAGPGGIWVVSSSGAYLTLISTPQTPTNCAWGDPDRKTLYITAQTSVYRIRPTIATGVNEQGRSGGFHYELGENFPNPFNPTSDITYQLSEFGPVRIAVYDLLGRVVSILVNEPKQAGNYTVRFDGSGLASGAYLCRMQAGNFVETRELLLLK